MYCPAVLILGADPPLCSLHHGPMPSTHTWGEELVKLGLIALFNTPTVLSWLQVRNRAYHHYIKTAALADGKDRTEKKREMKSLMSAEEFISCTLAPFPL